MIFCSVLFSSCVYMIAVASASVTIAGVIHYHFDHHIIVIFIFTLQYTMSLTHILLAVDIAS